MTGLVPGLFPPSRQRDGGRPRWPGAGIKPGRCGSRPSAPLT